MILDIFSLSSHYSYFHLFINFYLTIIITISIYINNFCNTGISVNIIQIMIVNYVKNPKCFCIFISYNILDIIIRTSIYINV